MTLPAKDEKMTKLSMLLALVAAAVATPADAQDGGWRHEASGISVPQTIGDMSLGAVRDASGGGNHDVILQFGEGRNPVTLYVYRSAYPNAALWFERTRHAMNLHVGAQGSDAAPNSFTLGGASAPNGLREDIALPAGGNFRATSVAIAQIGEWIVKARVSSATLDSRAVAERMDRLLAALRFSRATPAPLPLLVPPPCQDANRMRGSRIDAPSEAAVAAGLANAITAYAEARGSGGLAAEPGNWCREASQIPAQYGSIYRQRAGSEWVALVGDAGSAVSGRRLVAAQGPGAATFVSTVSGTSVAALYDDMPSPDAATVEALPILAGQAAGLGGVSIGSGTPEPK
jgi:hypothetical protein